RAIDDKLSHVRNVEDAEGVSYGLMFINDAGVLNRHQPAGEWNHFCAEPHVFVIKRRFSRRVFNHERNYARASAAQGPEAVVHLPSFDSSPSSSSQSRRRGTLPPS